ncbi:MAG: DUF5320 domain-containing protein [Crenarchaeota archaeon]|nr:DUF5320 domain-containing protein [Thermoproteota archaeon]
MLKGDTTGPWGAGPISERGVECCAGCPTPGSVNPIRRY